MHLRVELCFSRQVDAVKVAAWARELFLFLKIQNKQIIFGSNRINIFTLQRAELWPKLIVGRSRLVLVCLSEDFVNVNFFHFSA